MAGPAVSVPALLGALRSRAPLVGEAGHRRKLLVGAVSTLLASQDACDTALASELVLYGLLDVWSAIRADVRTAIRGVAGAAAWVDQVKASLITLLDETGSRPAGLTAPLLPVDRDPLQSLVLQRSQEWRGIEGALEALLVIMQFRLTRVSRGEVDRLTDAACRCLSHAQLTVRAAAVKTVGEVVRWHRDVATAGGEASLPAPAVAVLGRVLGALAPLPSSTAAGSGLPLPRPPVSAYHAEALLDTVAHLLQQTSSRSAGARGAQGGDPSAAIWLVPTEWWAHAWAHSTPSAPSDDGGVAAGPGPPLSELLVPAFLAHAASTVRQMASKVLACLALRSLPLARAVARTCTDAVDELPPPPSPAGALDSSLSGSGAGGAAAAAATTAGAGAVSLRGVRTSVGAESRGGGSPPPMSGRSAVTVAAAATGSASPSAAGGATEPGATPAAHHRVSVSSPHGGGAPPPSVAWHMREGALLVFDLLLSRLLRQHLRVLVASGTAPWAHAPASYNLAHIGAVHAGARADEDDDDARAHDPFVDRCAADWAAAAAAVAASDGAAVNAGSALPAPPPSHWSPSPLTLLTCCAGEAGACFPWRAVWLQVASCVQHSVFELTRMADALLPLLTTALAWAHAESRLLGPPASAPLRRSVCLWAGGAASSLGDASSDSIVPLESDGMTEHLDAEAAATAAAAAATVSGIDATVLERCLEGTHEAVKTRDAHRCMAFARALFVLHSVVREWESASPLPDSSTKLRPLRQGTAAPQLILSAVDAARSIAVLLARHNAAAQVLCVGAPTDAVLVLGLEVLCLACTGAATTLALPDHGLCVAQSMAVVIDRASRVMSVALARSATSPAANAVAGAASAAPEGDSLPLRHPLSPSAAAPASAEESPLMWPPSLWPGAAEATRSFLPESLSFALPPAAEQSSGYPACAATSPPLELWVPAAFAYATTERVRGLILLHRLRRREHLRHLSAVRQASMGYIDLGRGPDVVSAKRSDGVPGHPGAIAEGALPAPQPRVLSQQQQLQQPLFPAAQRTPADPVSLAAALPSDLMTPMKGPSRVRVLIADGGRDSGGTASPLVDGSSPAPPATRRGVLVVEPQQHPHQLSTPSTSASCLTSPHTLLASSDRFFHAAGQQGERGGPGSAQSAGGSGGAARLPSMPEDRPRSFPLNSVTAPDSSERSSSKDSSPGGAERPQLHEGLGRIGPSASCGSEAPTLAEAALQSLPLPYAAVAPSPSRVVITRLNLPDKDGGDAGAAHVPNSAISVSSSSFASPTVSSRASAAATQARALREAPSFLLQSQRTLWTPVASAASTEQRRSHRRGRGVAALLGGGASLREGEGEHGPQSNGTDDKLSDDDGGDGDEDDEEVDAASEDGEEDAAGRRRHGGAGGDGGEAASVGAALRASQMTETAAAAEASTRLAPAGGGGAVAAAHARGAGTTGGGAGTVLHRAAGPGSPGRLAPPQPPTPASRSSSVPLVPAADLCGFLRAPQPMALSPAPSSSGGSAWMLRAAALLTATATALIPFVPSLASVIAQAALTRGAAVPFASVAAASGEPPPPRPARPPLLRTPSTWSGGAVDGGVHLLLQLLGISSAWSLACLARVPMPTPAAAAAAASPPAAAGAVGAPASASAAAAGQHPLLLHAATIGGAARASSSSVTSAVPATSSSVSARPTFSAVHPPLPRHAIHGLSSRTAYSTATAAGVNEGASGSGSSSPAVIPLQLLRPCLAGVRAVGDALRILVLHGDGADAPPTSTPAAAAAVAMTIAALLTVAADASAEALDAERELLAAAGPSAVAGIAAGAVENAAAALGAVAGLAELLRDLRVASSRAAADGGVGGLPGPFTAAAAAAALPQPLAASISAALHRCVVAARALDSRIPPATGHGGPSQGGGGRAAALGPLPFAPSAVTPLLWRGHVLHKIHSVGVSPLVTAALQMPESGLLQPAAVRGGTGATALSAGPPPRLLAPHSAARSTAAAASEGGGSSGSSSAGLRSLVGLLPTPMGSAASRDFVFSSEDGGSSIGGGVSRTDPPEAEAAKDSSAAAGQWDDWDDATSDVSESGRSLESGAPGGGGVGGGASGVGCSGGSSARSLADGGGCSVAMLRVLQAADDTRVSLGLPPAAPPSPAPAGSRW